MNDRLPVRLLHSTILISILICWMAPASAIVIRHDREDQAYRDLGDRHPAAVSILPDGTGVLIAPDWVLTAAHVARGVSGRNPRVEANGREFAVSRIFIHPKWNDRGAHDIALLRLAEPVGNVKPVSLYAGKDEIGSVVTFVGRGDFGTGLTGPKTMDRVKRGATNVVDDADDDWLFFTFEQGNAATDLEGVSGPGDSGGPALVEVDGQLFTVGVSVFADGDNGPGRYGVREGYTRVSTHRRWINKVLRGGLDDQGFAPENAESRAGGSREVVMAMGGGSKELPDTGIGKLVAAYIEAYNSNDEEKMADYIKGNFAESYRETRTDAEHIALYRRLYDELFGRLQLSQVREATDGSVTVLFEGARGTLAEFKFDVTGESKPRIDGMRIAQVDVSMR